MGVFVLLTQHSADSSSLEEPKILIFFNALLERRKLELTLNFRERQVICQGAPILSIEKGAGIQFLESSADLKKDVGDFVETLRDKVMYKLASSVSSLLVLFFFSIHVTRLLTIPKTQKRV